MTNSSEPGTPRRRTSSPDDERQLQLFIDSVVDYAIFTVDTDNRITTWNTGAERLLGWRESEVIGRPADIVFTPEDRAAGGPESEFRTAAATGSAADERIHLRKDGTRFWATGTLMAMRDEDGTHRGYAKIMRDNTERRLAQESLERALREAEAHRAEAERANRTKDEFISTVSHELRTPLNNIRLWSRILTSGRLPHEKWGDAVRVIERAAMAQQQLIEDLLDISRMERGKLRISMRPARLLDLLQDALESIQPMLETRDLRVEQALGDDLGVVNLDPERMQQVMWNLLANAVKFTPDGGSIRVTAERTGDEVEIRVADTGEGIASDFLPHVFDRFRQFESSTTRSHAGLGLGLAIAKQLVELHGGGITAASEGAGRGSTFTIRLPLPVLDEERLPRPEVARGGVRPLHGVKVLLVEDETDTREAMGRLLAMDGAEVHFATTAAEARERYLAGSPDLILCDIGLPGEDGLSWIRWLRSTERSLQRDRVPALAVTAFARAEDERAALEAGFDRHIAKPVDEERLAGSIAETLQQRVA